MADQFYNAQGITVDQDFARFGSKSYAIDKITSTDLKITRPHMALAVVLLLIGLLFLLSAIGGFVAGLLIGLIACAGAIWLMTREAFSLLIVTSASELNVHQSKDRDSILDIKAAVEAAMISTKIK